MAGYFKPNSDWKQSRQAPQNQPWNRQGGQFNAPKKRSGAKLTIDKNGNPCISAWKASKGVIISLIASQKESKNISTGKSQETEYETKTGGVGQVWLCKISWGQGRESLHNGFFNPQTKKLRIPEVNMVASCNGGIGGYFGKSLFKPR